MIKAKKTKAKWCGNRLLIPRLSRNTRKSVWLVYSSPSSSQHRTSIVQLNMYGLTAGIGSCLEQTALNVCLLSVELWRWLMLHIACSPLIIPIKFTLSLNHSCERISIKSFRLETTPTTPNDTATEWNRKLISEQISINTIYCRPTKSCHSEFLPSHTFRFRSLNTADCSLFTNWDRSESRLACLAAANLLSRARASANSFFHFAFR